MIFLFLHVIPVRIIVPWYYISSSLPVICWLFTGDMYYCSSLSFDLLFVCEEASGTVRDAVTVVLSATLLPIKSPVASVNFA